MKGYETFFQYLRQFYFQEADNWTVLSSDVDKVFESGDVKAVSLKNYSTVMLHVLALICIFSKWKINYPWG